MSHLTTADPWPPNEVWAAWSAYTRPFPAASFCSFADAPRSVRASRALALRIARKRAYLATRRRYLRRMNDRPHLLPSIREIRLTVSLLRAWLRGWRKADRLLLHSARSHPIQWREGA